MPIYKNDFINEFGSIVKLPLKFDPDYTKELDPFLVYINGKKIRSAKERSNEFIALINKKFDLNAKAIGELYTHAASQSITFNFHQKNSIQRSFDLCDLRLFKNVLVKKRLDENTIKSLLNFFKPTLKDKTISKIHQEYYNPSKLRIEEGNRNIKSGIVRALFSAFLWVSLPAKEMHAYFDSDFSAHNYQESFWKQLQVKTPDLFNRDNALHILRINQILVNNFTNYLSLRDGLVGTISSLFKKINNHGFLSIVVEPISLNGRVIEWELLSDLILAAEKFKEIPLEKNYFQWNRIKDATYSHIENLRDQKTSFNLVNEGFTYRDTFVIGNGDNEIKKMLIIFQKNERDETVISCPTCRSANVQGNSYSNLGVKSWECNNLFCPDRTANPFLFYYKNCPQEIDQL